MRTKKYAASVKRFSGRHLHGRQSLTGLRQHNGEFLHDEPIPAPQPARSGRRAARSTPATPNAQLLDALRAQPFEDLGFARVDHHRAVRQGFPEVVLGLGKTPAQIAAIAAAIVGRGSTLLVTRATAGGVRRRARRACRGATYYADAAHHRASTAGRRARARARILVVAAGTSDLPVAEEAARTAELMGNEVDRLYDVGVAGIHRLLGERARLDAARVIIVVAGMEGALPSVVAGLVACRSSPCRPRIGYGASFGGIAALLGMLNSCASGVSVVNIDNGFGAGQYREPDQSSVEAEGSGLGQSAVVGSSPEPSASSAPTTHERFPASRAWRFRCLQLMQPGVLRALEFDRIVEAVRGFALDADGRRAPGAARAVDRSADGRPAARRDDRDGALSSRKHGVVPAARARATCRRFSTRSAVEGRAARSAPAAGARGVSRVGRRDARRDPPRAPVVSAARPGERGGGVVQGRDRADARQDRPVRRRRRPREPGAEDRSASGCASSGRGCAARSSRTCAARTRRSTCRIRSSPSGTAATCWS